MAEEKTKGINSEGNERWRSRKSQMAAAMFVAPFLVSTIAFLVMGKMNADQWSSFNQFLIPTILGIYGAANVLEKKVLKDK